MASRWAHSGIQRIFLLQMYLSESPEARRFAPQIVLPGGEEEMGPCDASDNASAAPSCHFKNLHF